MAVNGGHAGTKKGPNWGHVTQGPARFSRDGLQGLLLASPWMISARLLLARRHWNQREARGDKGNILCLPALTLRLSCTAIRKRHNGEKVMSLASFCLSGAAPANQTKERANTKSFENTPACYRAPRCPDPEFPRKIPKK